MQLADDFTDERGKPLLDDSSTSEFVSNQYPSEAVIALKQYELEIMNGGHVVKLLRMDLRLANSKMKSATTSQPWHSTMSQRLTKFADETQIRELPLLPLRSGSWVCPGTEPVYFPTVTGITVPIGVDLRVIDPAAVANEHRRSFFAAVGVVKPSITQVRASVRNRYGRPSSLPTLAESISHLRFLYLSRTSVPRPVQSDFRRLTVHTFWLDGANPQRDDVYLTTEDPYGSGELFKAENDTPEFRACFLHCDYLSDPPELPDPRHLSWKRWLCGFLGIREHVRLIARNGTTLSEAWTYMKTHRPDKLLGLLEHLWGHDGLQIKGSEQLMTRIQLTNSQKLCMAWLPERCRLRDTYIPTPALQG